METTLSLNHLTYIPALIASLILAGIVFINNRKHPANLSFTALILALSLWILSTLQADTLKDVDLVLFWNRFSIMGPLWIPSLFLFFSINFPRFTRNIIFKEQILLFVPPFLASFLVPTDFNVSSVEIHDWGSDISVGILYPVLGLFFLVYMGTAAVILYRKYHTMPGSARTQIKFLALGVFLTALVALTTNLVLPILGTARLSILGPPSSLILVSLVTYSIIKHRLMDIRLAVRVGILKLLMMAILAGGFYLLAQGYLTILGATAPHGLLMAVTITAAFLVFIYSPLDHLIRHLTDKILFQREYSAQALLRDLGRKMVESLDLRELLSEIEKTLKEVMRVEYVGFVLQTEVGGQKSEVGGVALEIRGFSDHHAYSWTPENILLEQMRASPKILVYDELKREISEEGESPQRARKERVAAELEKISAGVLIPLITKEEVNGLIVLGEKKGGDAFTSSDLDTLETLKYQMGVAIENAMLFSEVQSFNRKLSLEVTRATSDLQVKNRNLSVLRKLDTIIINTLELSEMCQKIVDTISWEAGFLGGLIALLEMEGSEQFLRAYAISSTPTFQKALKILPQKLESYRLPLALDPSNLMIKALRERVPQASDHLCDYYSPPLPLKLCQELEKILKIEHHVAYPLSAKGRALGVIVFGLPHPYEKLSSADLDLITAFMDQAGIAIENARLYEDLKKINADLKSANERLLSLDKMKDELVSVASHELRTPMTAIKSYLWMLLHKHADEIRNPKLQEYISRAYESSERMINLVNDMLSVSKIDTGRLELELKPTDFKILIKSVIADLETTAKQEKVALSFDEPQGFLPKALIDENNIREVLINLLGNALKFTPAGGKVWVDLKRNGKILTIGIHDTGQGIHKEDLPRLFQKFGRLDTSFVTAAETGGTGLGLYISRGIVELHGGKIWVKSAPGKGSHFYFTVRVAG